MKLVYAEPQVLWTSPLDNCQLCGRDFGGIMYDAKVGGPWGNICQTCFDDNSCRLGTGLGQRYKLQTLGDTKAWIKTAG